MPIFILILVVFLLTPAAAAAQPAPIEDCPSFAEKIADIVNGVPEQTNQSHARDLLNIARRTKCFAVYIATRPRPQAAILLGFIRRFESSRSDKQSGAGASGSGSTSVVSQGPTARVLSVAAEYGAFTQSVDGQVITIRGNAAGLPSALVRHGVAPYCIPNLDLGGYCVGNSALGVLRKVSFAVGFNALQQTQAVGTAAASGSSAASQPVTFEATTNQLASASIRIDLWNRRNTDSADFRAKWQKEIGAKISSAADALMAKAGAFAEPIFDDPGYAKWLTKHAAEIRKAGQNKAAIVTALNIALDEVLPIMQSVVPDLEDAALEALGAYGNFLMAQDMFIDEIATKKVVSFEFTNNRPSSKPHTSNAKLVVDAPLTKKDKLVANVGVTWYDQSQTNTDGTATKYRDAQAAVQYERGLGEVAIIGPATLSFAFYYQYQHAPALLTVDPSKPILGVTFVDLPANAKTVFAEKGDIVLGQVKLSLTPKESSVKVPLAVTYSNRTEFITKPAWKAQIGVTYDFDSLFARGK